VVVSMCIYYIISAAQTSKNNVLAPEDSYNHGYMLLNKFCIIAIQKISVVATATA